MGLSVEERKLILKLISNPLASVTNLANDLNRSRPTVLSQFKRLNGKCKVQAFIKLSNINLKRANFFLECSFSNIPLLEEIIKAFPYSNYRTRVIGSIKGIYVQFSIPSNLKLDDFFSILTTNGIVKKIIDVTPSSKSYLSNFELTKFNEEANDFNFDWKKLRKNVNSEPTPLSKNKRKIAAPFTEEIINEIEPVDMYILASMSDDARKRGSSLLSPTGEVYSTDIPPYVLSNRINFIKSNLIDSYKVQLDWELFNIYQALIFYSHGPFEEEFIHHFGKIIMESLPFDSVFNPINNNKGFSWFVAVPPSHFPQLLSFVWEICKDIDFECFSVDYHSSARYMFYGFSTFDFKNRTWKISPDYLFDEINNILESR